MKVYISGPITGQPNKNREAFTLFENLLKESGHDPVNPHLLVGDDPLSWAAAMKIDLREMLLCDAVLLLPGWTKSEGARLEFMVAEELRIPTFVGPWEPLLNWEKFNQVIAAMKETKK